APAVRLWPGQRGPAQTPALVREAIVETAKKFAEKAEQRGLRLDFEFHENTLTETPESTLALLDAIDHASVRTLWQPPMQTSPAERLEGLRQVLPHVSNVHCNFFGQNPWPHACALHEGASEWREYLALLAEADPARWVLIEHVRDHAPAALLEDAATLRRWLSGDFSS
ncbi:MAG: sugar phosphate isomerase/epimerase family protein, partial [Verrucomicrobiota bacterium]